MVSRAVRLCGTELVDPPMRTLTAGPLSAELDNGALRYVRFGGVEVLRAIAFLVRDENWGTFTPTIENLRDRRASDDGFTVSYRATCADAKRAARLRRDDHRQKRRVARLRGRSPSRGPTCSPTAPASSCCTRSTASPAGR